MKTIYLNKWLNYKGGTTLKTRIGYQASWNQEVERWVVEVNKTLHVHVLPKYVEKEVDSL